MPLEEAPPPKKGICSSRSFGRAVATLEELSEAISSYVSRAAEKLRVQQSVASILHIYLTTNRFKDTPQYANALTMKLPVSTAYTPHLINYAKEGLKKIYKPGYHYQKVGVCLTGIVPRDQVQLNLFFNADKNLNLNTRLMNIMDSINSRWERDTVQYAALGIKKSWRMRQSLKSQNFTTRWNELPVVKAS
jgi:DNA polymerase V